MPLTRTISGWQKSRFHRRTIHECTLFLFDGNVLALFVLIVHLFAKVMYSDNVRFIGIRIERCLSLLSLVLCHEALARRLAHHASTWPLIAAI